MDAESVTKADLPPKTRHRSHALIFSVVAFMTLQWVGCSVEKNYEMLSKFFDGVPDPNAVEPQDRLAISKSPTFSEHKPFVDEDCYRCHTDPTQMMLSKDDSSMCLTCHSQIKEQYKMMHGAVTGNACLMCHNPHLSRLSHLLREEAPALCLQCHEMPTQNLAPPHQDPEQSCLACHRAHGGDAPYFLLSTLSVEQPESQGEYPGKIDGP